ncbi:MAG: murein transglycosylase [Sphingomonadales bacterium RIFCSPLOWO2_12_FULL_63_15]|nr:MAG: murein transglycosylase [Sphingomonadales bacterium RIFCSPLOWO2_12_FULL_63_15]
MEASAAQQRTADERIVAACIARSAAGRGWLEKTLWGLRDQEGGWIGAEIANSDGSHDLGPLQVNSWWVPRLAAVTGRPERHIRHWLKQDACFNVEAARWIFLSGLAVTRDYWKAIGAYHSPTVWRQRRYAGSVATKLRGRFGAVIFDAGKAASDATN